MNTIKKLPLYLLLFVLLTPLFFLGEAWLLPSDKAWVSFIEDEFTSTMLSTFFFTFGTVFLSAIMGISAAYIMIFYRFPFQSFFQWALILPLALPAYILGFTYLGLFEPTGALQSILREYGFINHIPSIKNIIGAIVFKSFTLYPYIYLITKAAFATQSIHLIESATLLGYSKRKIIYKVLLPLSWPWIFSGMMLVFMEAVADFGMVWLFNIETFTTIIYKKWGGEHSLLTAWRISSFLIIFLTLFFLLQSYFKGSRKVFTNVKEGINYQSQMPTNVLLKWCHFLFISFLFIFSFLLPVLLLVGWAFKDFQNKGLDGWVSFLPFVLRSLTLSLFAAIIITAVGVVFALYDRNEKSVLLSRLIKFSSMGYALPGTLLGIGVFSFLHFFEIKLGFVNILKSSIFGLMIGYLIRFNAVAYENVFSAYERIPPSLDESGFLLGKSVSNIFCKIHLPLIKASLLSSIILIFVDVMKELPLTLIMRPYGWDTLPIKIYNFSEDGDWVRASFPALLLISVGVLPIILLTKFSSFQTKRG